MLNLNEIIDTKEKFIALLVAVVIVFVLAVYAVVTQLFKG